MSKSKTRTYEIVSKAMLEKIQQESSNEKLLEEVRLEFLKNKESARVVQNYVATPEKPAEKSPIDQSKSKQKTKLSTKSQPKRNQHYEICDFCFKQIIFEKYKTHFEKTCPKRPKYFTAKIGWENQDLDKITEIAKIADRKKKSKIREFQMEIQKLRTQLNSLNSKKKPCSILKLKAAIQVKIGTLGRFIGTEPINKPDKLPKLNDKKSVSLNTTLKSDRKYRNCPYCSASISEKNYSHHIISKCPKKPHTNEGKLTIQNEINDPIMSVEKISWTLLPKGEWLFEKLTNHFKHLNSLSHWKNKPFDETRFQKIEKTLRPNKCFVGKGEFEGYIAYCFDWTESVILECPIYGNAIYIIKRGKFTWQEIAKASKWEARTEYSAQVKVINHSNTWLERLEENLRYGF